MSQAKHRVLQEATLKYIQEKQVYEKIKRRRRRGLYRRLAAYGVLTAILSASFLSLFLSQHRLLNEKAEEKQRLQEELASIEKQEIRLREEIKKLHDDEYIGELARRDYFFSKEDETIFTFPNEKARKNAQDFEKDGEE